jgi:hypothetical protein
MRSTWTTRIVVSLLAAVGVGVGAAAPAAVAAPTTSDYVATFLVAGSEVYRIRLTDADDIDTARSLLKGSTPLIPSGLIVYGWTDVNLGWSWHIDPASVTFSRSAVEVCDGLPSSVERHQITSPYYCPWGARIQSLQPATFPYQPPK